MDVRLMGARLGVRGGDVVIAVAITAIAVVVTAFSDPFSRLDRPVDALAIALAAAAGLPLLVRRRYPTGTLAVVTALCTTYLLLSYPYGPILSAYFAAVYTVARYEPWARAVIATALAMVVLLTHLLVNDAAFDGLVGLVPGSAWAVVPFAVGVVVRVRQESVERERAEEVRQRAYDERLRVAQEVHDVVGHGLAAIKMQAEVALHLMSHNPEHAEIALTNISRTSTEALSEVRSTLAAVRRPDDPRAPSPSLSRLDDLRRRLGESGVRIDLTTTGTARELPVAADLAGYRVVQEALTNVLRHGAARSATVRIDYRDDVVVIAVSNPTVSDSAVSNAAVSNSAVSNGTTAGGGHGIVGMRQRVTSLGGTFTAGPTGDGRFEVHASIPREVRS